MRPQAFTTGAVAHCLSLAYLFLGAAAVGQTAPPTQPSAQPQRTAPSSPTTTYSPENGDNVVVGFSNGTARAPVVTGPLQNGTQPAPTAAGSNSRLQPLQVQKRGLKPECTQTSSASSPPAHAVKDANSKATPSCPSSPCSQKPEARAAGGSNR